MLKSLLVLAAIFGAVLLTRAVVSQLNEPAEATPDMYTTAQRDVAGYTDIIVKGCTAEAPGQEAYCRCYADNIMATDRDTFTAFMDKSIAGELTAADVTPYAEPCFSQLQ